MYARNGFLDVRLSYTTPVKPIKVVQTVHFYFIVRVNRVDVRMLNKTFSFSILMQHVFVLTKFAIFLWLYKLCVKVTFVYIFSSCIARMREVRKLPPKNILVIVFKSLKTLRESL